MYLRDSQVTIMPKYMSNDIGGQTYKYSSDHIVMKGGKKSKNRISRKRIRSNRGTRKNRKNGKK